MKKQSGFTLIELLVVIAIIAILAAILFPVFANAKRAAQQSMCANNLKQISMGFLAYSSDNNTRFPIYNYAPWNETTWWPATVKPYIKNAIVLVCPSAPKPADGTKHWCNYGLNFWYLNKTTNDITTGLSMGEVRRPTATVAICEVARGDGGDYNNVYSDYVAYSPGLARSGNYLQYVNRPGDWHNGSNNVAFVDGHVRLMKLGAEFYPKLPWDGANASTNPRNPKYKDQLWDLR